MITSFDNNKDKGCLLLKNNIGESYIRSRTRSRVKLYDHRFRDHDVTKDQSKPTLLIKNIIKPVLIVWDSSCRSCKRPTTKLKYWWNKRPTDTKKSIRFFTMRAYNLYPKLFEWRWLALSTTIFWPAILGSKRPEVVNPKILLVNFLPQRHSKDKKLWCLFSPKSDQLQAL